MTPDKVHVPLGARAYDILIGSLGDPVMRQRLVDHVGQANHMVVSDGSVQELHGDMPGFSGITLEPGEQNKTLTTVGAICAECASRKLDRKSFLIARGGGVTGDLTGFAAAIYMRGIRFIQIPTTLLAMVDSSVGGKTGADLPEGKNLVGAFHQPDLVLIDPSFLRTLPDTEIRCGLAEIVKYGVIMDEAFFERLETVAEAVLRRDETVFAELIAHSCRLKAEVVVDDETEQGRRAILNYGHTFGHAVEQLSHFTLGHGVCVAAGMAIAGRLSVLLDFWSKAELDRQNSLLTRLGLPTTLDRSFAANAVLESMRHDKKTLGGGLRLVLPRSIGHAELCANVPEEAVLQAIESAYD